MFSRVNGIPHLPCCSIRSVLGSVQFMNATANQFPGFGPDMFNVFTSPLDGNSKWYISNLCTVIMVNSNRW